MWNNIDDFLWWYINNDLACFVGRGDEITGLSLVRPVAKAEDGKKWYDFDRKGDCLYVDFAISKTKEAKAKLLLTTIEKFPLKHVAFARTKRSDKINQYSFQEFLNKFIKN